MKIVTVPHPALAKVSRVIDLDQNLAKFLTKLENTLRYKQNPAGVGLSAPQVAKNWRVFSLYLDHDKPDLIRSYINPKVVDQSDQLTLSEEDGKPFLEGCLSIPNVYGPVKRHQWIELEFAQFNPLTSQYETLRKKFSDFPARVVQHELDHLDGILFTQRALEQGLEIFEEINGKLVATKV